jgi:Rrf2 family transcriptional regulator, iron-sulfur cluster assembly transcription factor
MLSNTSKYAIRATIYIALYSKPDSKIGIKKIAEDLNIPSPFLAKILQTLVRRKILSSTKGPNGGFSLVKDADKISLYEIVTVIDGDDVFRQCMISLRTCHENSVPCAVHQNFEPIRTEMKRLFKEQTIQDLARGIIEQNQSVAL